MKGLMMQCPNWRISYPQDLVGNCLCLQLRCPLWRLLFCGWAPFTGTRIGNPSIFDAWPHGPWVLDGAAQHGRQSSGHSQRMGQRGEHHHPFGMRMACSWCAGHQSSCEEVRAKTSSPTPASQFMDYLSYLNSATDFEGSQDTGTSVHSLLAVGFTKAWSAR